MSVELLWFVLVAIALAIYVVLDGFDFGVGMLMPWVARDERERGACLRSIGPVWDGNEVWLLAGGGTLYFAFPGLYGRAFSGFYLPLMMTLWLLVLRAVAIELRHQLDNAIWRPLWDAVLAGASLLLAAVLGAALGNIVRGVPMDARGRFFAPLWTDFTLRGDIGVLDWFTTLVSVTAVCSLALHGALWINDRVGEPVAGRARALARRLWLAAAFLTLSVSVASLAIQPSIARNFAVAPWGVLFPLAAALGLAGALLWMVRGASRRAFAASSVYILGMIGSAVFGVFPHVLPGRVAGTGLSLYEAAAPPNGLWIGLSWWLPGMALVGLYFWFMYSRLPNRCEVGDEDEH